MKTIELKYPFDYRPNQAEQAACAIGFFDGIHKGHQYVLQTAKDLANRLNKKLAVMTFTPHPSVVIKGGPTYFTYLNTFQQKKQILADFGVEILYVIHFDPSVAQLEPQKFIDHYIVDLNISQLVCGFDFTYGYRGAGNVNTLIAHSKERFGIHVVDKFNEGNQKVSSTRIRQLLAAGEVEQAKNLLTRPLMTEGTVIHGYKRGREIGYPTANIAVKPEQLIPKIGVYYVTVLINGQTFHGMASLGYNPTFENPEKEIKCEVYIFDFNQMIYDQSITVAWEKYIRPEFKFETVDQLIAQLKEDEKEIRQLF